MVEYRSASEADLDAVRAFLAENGWGKRVADFECFRMMIRNADRTVVAFDGGRIVGFARALCDDASNGYIGTVAVAQEMRGQGIGSMMVNRLMGNDPRITWVLRAGRGSEGFWKKMGFTRSEVAMERIRID